MKLSRREALLIKEAAKTAEFFDDRATLESAAERIADLIKGAKSCTAFTGAGISTSAGIGRCWFLRLCRE